MSLIKQSFDNDLEKLTKNAVSLFHNSPRDAEQVNKKFNNGDIRKKLYTDSENNTNNSDEELKLSKNTIKLIDNQINIHFNEIVSRLNNNFDLKIDEMCNKLKQIAIDTKSSNLNEN